MVELCDKLRYLSNSGDSNSDHWATKRDFTAISVFFSLSSLESLSTQSA
jgi:hypothetical protein